MLDKPILVVDDDLLSLELLSYLLVDNGYHNIKSTTSAEDALVILKDFKPQLILLDIKLPGMDGYTLTKILKADPNYKDIPIVAITAYAMKGDKEKALAAGFDDYIPKPIDIKTFPSIIAQHLQKERIA